MRDTSRVILGYLVLWGTIVIRDITGNPGNRKILRSFDFDLLDPMRIVIEIEHQGEVPGCFVTQLGATIGHTGYLVFTYFETQGIPCMHM